MQVYSYFVATVDGWSGDKFDAEVDERRADVYLLAACILSKFGDCTLDLCKAFLAKACGLLRTLTWGGGMVQDGRHQQVLLATQDVFYSLGFLDGEEMTHLALHRLPNVCRSSIYYVKSCLLHAKALEEGIENCLAFVAGSDACHSRVHRCPCYRNILRSTMMSAAEDALKELGETMSRVKMACSENKAYFSELKIAQYRERFEFYDVLVSGLDNERRNTQLQRGKIRKLAERNSCTRLGSFMYNVLHRPSPQNWDLLETEIVRERLRIESSTPEPVARANSLFTQCLSLLCVNLLVGAMKKVNFEPLCVHLDALEVSDPGHHRLGLMRFFNSCCFHVIRTCSDLPFKFSATTLLCPSHTARNRKRDMIRRVDLEPLNDCLCPGPRAGEKCKCYEVQEARSEEWMQSLSFPLLKDRELADLLLKNPSVLGLPAMLSSSK